MYFSRISNHHCMLCLLLKNDIQSFLSSTSCASKNRKSNSDCGVFIITIIWCAVILIHRKLRSLLTFLFDHFSLYLLVLCHQVVDNDVLCIFFFFLQREHFHSNLSVSYILCTVCHTVLYLCNQDVGRTMILL